MSSENSTRLLVACVVGLFADGCKRRLHCARRAARCGCGSLVARGSFETCSPRSSGIGTLGSFADALVLRSLRAVPRVCRMPVWEQAEDINSECFSFLGSWSFRTRIPQRTRAQPTDRPTDQPTNRPTDQPTNILTTKKKRRRNRQRNKRRNAQRNT